MTFELTQEEYEALVALAREGAKARNNPVAVRRLEDWLRLVEKHNGITRDIVVVKWQELDAPLPPGTFFPTVWPPELTRSIEFVTRPVAKADVEKMLEAHAKNPTQVMCTHDPAGIYGLTPLDQFFPK